MTSISNITEELKVKVRSLVKQVVVNEHSNPNKHMIKEMPGRINLACPYCGDSSNDSLKKRGNLYWTTLQYHCFNCGHHTDVYNLLKDHDIRLKDKMDSINIIEYIKEHKVETNNVETLQYGIFQKIHELSPTRKEIKDAFNFEEIEIGSPAFFYLRKRLLGKKLENFLYSPSDKRIVVLNLAPKDKIIGFQTRSLNKRKNTRYLTYDLEKIYGEMKKPLEISEEEMMSIKKLSTIFGIMMVNFQEDVTIFEGPIDAMFMHNTLGLASAGRSTEELDEIPTIRYMFDNDEVGKKKMIEKLKKGKRVFMWSRFIKENKMNIYNSQIKDLNDLVISSWEHKNKCLTKVNDYFTDSQLDVYYL